MDNSELEIWKSNKFHKLNKYYTTYIPLSNDKANCNKHSGWNSDKDWRTGRSFFKVYNGNMAVGCLDINGLRTLKILKMKLRRQISEKNRMMIEKLLV